MSKAQPPRGFRDFLPEEFVRRERLKRIIAETYESFGYRPIDTPVLESINVLLGKGGGENEKLMFMVLKRGEKLKGALEASVPSAPDLSDTGLRFDLTVPLARFVATNQGKLPPVFKRYQIGPVWRADRPQQGRFREFTQCDVDVIGSAEPAADADVILATAECLARLGFEGLSIHVNSRPLLKRLVLSFGVGEERLEDACRTLDKLDKIGLEGVASELEKEGFLPEVRSGLAAFGELFAPLDNAGRLDALAGRTGESGAAYVENLRRIMDLCPPLEGARLVVDPFLVRGMDYYTGPVYEIRHPDVPFSLAGGGRYDGLVGMFSGREIPATGFSIGFERILTLLADKAEERAALVDAAVWAEAPEREAEAFRLAGELRRKGFKVDALFGKRSRGKLLAEMEEAGARVGVILKADGEVEVRDLSARKSENVSPAEAVERVLEILKPR